MTKVWWLARFPTPIYISMTWNTVKSRSDYIGCVKYKVIARAIQVISSHLGMNMWSKLSHLVSDWSHLVGTLSQFQSFIQSLLYSLPSDHVHSQSIAVNSKSNNIIFLFISYSCHISVIHMYCRIVKKKSLTLPMYTFYIAPKCMVRVSGGRKQTGILAQILATPKPSGVNGKWGPNELGKLTETKVAAVEGEHSKTTNDSLICKIQLLKDVTERCMDSYYMVMTHVSKQ